MRRKNFCLHFRYRNNVIRFGELDRFGELVDAFEGVETTSEADAKRTGKRLAAERAPSYGGKFWFMGLDGKGIPV